MREYVVPRNVSHRTGIENFLRQRCAELGVIIDALIPLGGACALSAGATPELVTPFAAPIAAISADLKFAFTPMQPLHAHTKSALLRLGHALQG